MSKPPTPRVGLESSEGSPTPNAQLNPSCSPSPSPAEPKPATLDSGHKFWTPERLAKSAAGLPSSWPTPDGSKLSADQIKAVIRSWLEADDATHFGDFEKGLAALVYDEAEGDGIESVCGTCGELVEACRCAPPVDRPFPDHVTKHERTWEYLRFRFFRDIDDQSRRHIIGKLLDWDGQLLDEASANHGTQGLAIDQWLRRNVLAPGQLANLYWAIEDAVDGEVEAGR